MLSLGGVIGSGLFFGTGHIIANVGAFGTVLAYLIGAFMVYLIMLSLGELSVAHPDPGSFHLIHILAFSPQIFTTVILFIMPITRLFLNTPPQSYKSAALYLPIPGTGL